MQGLLFTRDWRHRCVFVWYHTKLNRGFSISNGGLIFLIMGMVFIRCIFVVALFALEGSELFASNLT